MNTAAPPAVQVEKLSKHFPLRAGLLRRVTGRVTGHLKAVDGVSLEIAAGETFGLVGESGCGKSTLGRTTLRLLEPTSGRIVLDGEDISRIQAAALKPRRRLMQMIFQDPYASLNPRRTIEQILLEPLQVHRIGSAIQRRQRVQELLELVGLGSNALQRYPHEFSGGQRQRIGIARALAPRPSFVVADEAVSALDVSVQSQVLNLLSDLQMEMGVAMLFISHDLAVVQHIAHTVGVMYMGQLVEKARSDDLFNAPRHPYTQALINAIPIPVPGRPKIKLRVHGEVPSALKPPAGCAFHPRCPKAMAVCKTQKPVTLNVAENHTVSCHLYDES